MKRGNKFQKIHLRILEALIAKSSVANERELRQLVYLAKQGTKEFLRNYQEVPNDQRKDLST